MQTHNNPDQLLAAFEVEELEERLEFVEWKIKADCRTDFDGNTTCGGGVEATF